MIRRIAGMASEDGFWVFLRLFGVLFLNSITALIVELAYPEQGI